MIVDHQARVALFMQKAEQETPTRPTMPDADIRKLRAKLILEEAFETVKALGVVVECNLTAEMVAVNFDHLIFTASDDPDRAAEYVPDLAQIVDGCCDVSVVTVGTMVACGLPMEPFLMEVDESNLSKFIDGYRRADGKWMKGPSWQPPNIEGLLAVLSE